MHHFPSLDSLGPRICICGPSNAGKSTLAAALGRKLGRPVVHLDQLHHQPNTNWVPRPREEFEKLHDAAILGDSWVMEGNYSGLYPRRMARASSIILLGDNRWANFRRYLRRTIFQKNRVGNLEGAQDSIKWVMVNWILFHQPKRRSRDIRLLKSYDLPMIKLDSMRELNALYSAWGLSR